MFSHTKKNKCLIIEDDIFKLDSIKAYLKSTFNIIEIITCQALSTATAHISNQKFDLVIIDMSIHSHEPEAGAGSPVPLPSGGLDVLFEIEYSNQSAVCIILTQYPDIPIEEIPVPIEIAAKEIQEKFGIHVHGCVKYVENSIEWKNEITEILKKYENRHT